MVAVGRPPEDAWDAESEPSKSVVAPAPCREMSLTESFRSTRKGGNECQRRCLGAHAFRCSDGTKYRAGEGCVMEMTPSSQVAMVERF